MLCTLAPDRPSGFWYRRREYHRKKLPDVLKLRLGATLHLTETISAWTTSIDVAKEFKGGVPPAGLQGVIFEVVPNPNMVVLNIGALYRDEAFRCACSVLSDQIPGSYDGICRYGGSQCEVVLEIESVSVDSVYALGGHSSSHEAIARQYFGCEPSSEERQWFDELLSRSPRKLGPYWLLGQAKNRVVSKMLEMVEVLRPLRHQTMPLS